MRKYNTPPSFERALLKYWQSLSSKSKSNLLSAKSIEDLSSFDSKKLGSCILRLSDWFISHPQGQTPWQEDWAQVAYMSYFTPLNLLRNLAVVDQGRRESFFEGIESVIDFGSGSGAALMALASVNNLKNFYSIERSIEATQLFDKNFKSEFFHSTQKYQAHFQQTQAEKLTKQELAKTLACFSYSLTELETIPNWALHCEAIMILEPATNQDGRRLMGLRAELIQNGFEILAPCTHQGECPLLKNSKTDWCHDRIHFEQANWWTKLEDELPIKNRTLTFSYLLARKNPNPKIEPSSIEETHVLGRTVGDQLVEKGKTRQLFCIDDQRQFLSWMDRDKNKVEISRGEKILIPRSLVEANSPSRKSNEVRIPANEKVIVLNLNK